MSSDYGTGGYTQVSIEEDLGPTREEQPPAVSVRACLYGIAQSEATQVPAILAFSQGNSFEEGVSKFGLHGVLSIWFILPRSQNPPLRSLPYRTQFCHVSANLVLIKTKNILFITLFTFGESQELLVILNSRLCSRTNVNMLRTVQISINAQSCIKITSYASVQTKTRIKPGDNTVVTIYAWGSGGNVMGRMWEEERQKEEQWLTNRDGQKREARAVPGFYNPGTIQWVTRAIIFTLLSRKKCYICFKDKLKWERYRRSRNNKGRDESWGLCRPAMGNEWLLKQTAASSNPWQNMKTKLCELWLELWCYFSLAQSST